MYILGIHDGHNSGACVLQDGKVVAAVSAERLSKVKNDTGYSRAAVAEVLKIAWIKPSDVEIVAIASTQRSTREWFMQTDTWYQSRLPEIVANAEFAFPPLRSLYPAVNFVTRNFIKRVSLDNSGLVDRIKDDFGFENAKFSFVDHHLSHAAASYYGRPWDSETLILTLDGRGDGICASVSIGKGAEITRISSTRGGHSVAEVYLGVTSFLGMKPLEHEYKVMGLAPYASKAHGEKAARLFDGLISINDDLSFSSKIRTNVSYYWVRKHFAQQRFDNVAYAVQKFTEDLAVEWVRKAVAKTGIPNVVLGGGLFMNVKLNKLVLELPEVKKLFIAPSCSDESLMIGAAMVEHAKASGRRPEPLKEIYYGGSFGDDYVKDFLVKNSVPKKYRVQQFKDINGVVAELLAKNKVVARCSGRMEFGARSLGNRSILANPSSFSNVRIINQMIKSRDFWMPFAPSILAEAEREYIINPKSMPSPYMILAFDSVEKNRDEIVAAMHQYDFTVRPQVVDKPYNSDYHSILKQFQKHSGIGAVLNTSFNLHGFPVVYSPEDAYYVFENSGLEYLQLGSFIISKQKRQH